MSRRTRSNIDEKDETLAKLETALQDAEGVDMRTAIRGAIEERKREIRRD